MSHIQGLNSLKKGNNLPKTTDGPIPCPDPFYELMLTCWNRKPENRPTFDYLRDFSTTMQYIQKIIIKICVIGSDNI
ncbi:hypothetical protein DPMN_057019 [Dreissena polymorpha]|uniref:Serine-threonine/tyrosine-protein kinase catalytic domain-containing protein n=1 Tax=Dreissena polymorpha TaxID=45954 RepID=A0A9D4CST9_DREPO|nr:hypothetical protein DPMN_057019 [Dreissena polymorpha]